LPPFAAAAASRSCPRSRARVAHGFLLHPTVSLRNCLFLAGLALTLATGRAAAAPEAFPGLNRKWTCYQSPNFELYSCRSDSTSRDLLERMELLRALFIDTFKIPVRMPQPVTIFAFATQKEFNAYLAPERRSKDVDWAGFCYAQADRTTITLAPAAEDEDFGKIVFHEYIHCLFHMTEKNPPPWFNEGVAELFSTLTEDHGWLIMGQPIPGRIQELRASRLIPLEQLFAVTHDSPVFQSSHTGLFYAESWAFLHFLQFGVNNLPPEKVSLFLRVGEAGNSQAKPAQFRAATRELLGMDYPELEKALEKYVNWGQFNGRKVRRPAVADKRTYAARPAAADEMTARLAEVSLRFTRSGYANLAVRNQLERRPKARLHEVLGTVALQEGEADLAREQWRQAFELGTTNVAIFRELSRLESNVVFSQFSLDYRLPGERAELLRALLAKSLDQAPEQSNGYEMLAWVEATAQKPDIASVLRVQKRFATLNDKPRTLLALALVRMRLGKNEEALSLLADMAKLDPDDGVLFCVEMTRARIEKRPMDPAKFPHGPASAPRVILTPPKLDWTR
jgi:tetratricopeptide (TPR) repeat protein